MIFPYSLACVIRYRENTTPNFTFFGCKIGYQSYKRLIFRMAHIKLEVPYQLNQKNRKQLSWAYNRSRKHIKRFLNLTSSWLVWHTGCLPVQPLKSSLVMLQYLSFYNHRQNLYYQICFILIQPTGYTITKGISNIWFSHYNHFFSVGKMRGKSENKKSPNLP